MVKKKHQFINKKSSHNFNVVHRSQRDPLQPDEESSQHVLVPVGGISEAGAGPSSENDANDDHVKFGIYYDDEYDYLQHLRPRGEGMLIMAEDSGPPTQESQSGGDLKLGNLNLPAEVLPSKYEENIGMLNKGVLPRGPQPDWDPDIVAALDDGVDFDDPDMVLQDDFIALAGLGGSETNDYDEDNFVIMADGLDNFHKDYQDKNNAARIDKSEKEWETESDVSSTANLDDFSDEEFPGEETKSHFTNYSMTSSVIRRTEGLKILDDRFECIMEEYAEEEIGPIDHEEPTGTFDVNSDLINQIVDEFIDNQKTFQLSEGMNEEHLDGDTEYYTENDDKLFEEYENKPSEKWDCESIISTYSNIYNHPKLIDEPRVIKLHKRTGIPLGVFKSNMENNDAGEELVDEDELREPVVLNNIRNKEESTEDKRVRKQCVKDERRKRRVEKKENKSVFKDEHLKQGQVVMNKANQFGIKM